MHGFCFSCSTSTARIATIIPLLTHIVTFYVYEFHVCLRDFVRMNCNVSGHEDGLSICRPPCAPAKEKGDKIVVCITAMWGKIAGRNK